MMIIFQLERYDEPCIREFGCLDREAKSKAVKYSLYVEQSRDYIAKHIYEKLSLQVVAEKVSVHKVYLSRIFVGQMGMPLKSLASFAGTETAAKFEEMTGTFNQMLGAEK